MSLGAVFDTNILIDFLRGEMRARDELERFDKAAISMVTWMEVLVGSQSEAESTRLRAFLSTFLRVPIDEEVANRAIALRRLHRIKLPDALIWATAQQQGALLVTRNTRDFPASCPDVRVPYTF
ncbi:MAG: type II toxin-antitoxin system VapC family toxin [Polyangiales bacterium]